MGDGAGAQAGARGAGSEGSGSLRPLVESLPQPKWGSYDVCWSGPGERCAREIAVSSDAETDTLWAAAPDGPAKRWYERQGWTVRGGMMYGCDYTLYRGSPDDFHSEYAVVVVDSGSPPPWTRIHGLARLVEGVRKSLLVCVVDSSASPVSLSHFCLSRCPLPVSGSGGSAAGGATACDE